MVKGCIMIASIKGYQCMEDTVCVCSVIQECPAFWDPKDCSPPSFSDHFPGKKTGVDFPFLLPNTGI